MTKSIFFFLFLYSAFAISKPCLENTNLDAQAVKLFKFESTCQNSLKSCKEIFDASFTQNKIAEPHEAIDNYQCKKGEKLKNIETGIAIAFGFKSAVDLQGLTSSQILDVIDFYHHTSLHIKRVGVLAEHLYKHFPHLFKDISIEDLRYAISFHDIEKVDSSLKSKRGSPFIIELYQYFAGPGDRNLIDELNSTGKEFLHEKLKKRGFTKEMMRSFEIIETISDIVDRTETPESVQEFMREMIRESERPNLNNPKKWKISEKQYIEMFKYLEENHSNIIPKDLKFTRPNMHQRLAIIEKIFVDPLTSINTNEKTTALLVNKIARLHAKTIHNKKSMARGLVKSPFASSIKQGGALLSNPLLDGLLIATYSPSTGCSELGSHPWTKINGKCYPVPGLSKEFLEGFVFNNNADIDSNTCKVIQENYRVNTQNSFNHQLCEQNGIKLANDKAKSLTVTFNNNYIKKIKISGSLLKSFGGNIAKSFIHSLKYDTKGMITEICFFKGNRGKSFATLPVLTQTYCQKDIDQIQKKYPEFFNEISSLNYKIFQVKNCCDGKSGFLNENITCEHSQYLVSHN